MPENPARHFDPGGLNLTRIELPRLAFVAAAFLACAYLIVTPVAWAGEPPTIHARFTPDKLGASTNLSATVTFGSAPVAPQSPAVKVTAYGPAGMSVDTLGAGICTATPVMLQEAGPTICPASSRIGFGNGVGLFELGKEILPGHFTLEFFLAPSQQGHLVMLVYVNSVSPASDQIVLVAREVRGPKPYGVGITFDVPTIASLPGAGLGWEEHVSVSLGSAHVAYYKTVHGKRKLIHVRGIVLPGTCPHGGFPIEAQLGFADGTMTTATSVVSCPHK
jgi:hypothetical protein